MKILFILHETSIHNGSWKSACNLLTGLRDNGIELMIVCPDKDGAYKFLIENGFNVVELKYYWNSDVFNPSLKQRIKYIPRIIRQKYYEYRWLRKAVKLCQDFKPDIIHSNSSVITCGFKLANRLNIPHIWHVREYGDLDFSLKLTESNRLLQLNKYSINVTKGVKSHRHCVQYADNQRVVYDGVYPCHRIHKIEVDKSDFLYVGSLNKGKGISDLLDAWKKAKENKCLTSFKLKICGGTDSDIADWLHYCSENGITDTKWLGKRDDVDKLMQHARAVVVPSFFEAFGRVMPEAIANGALVIGRNTAGTKEQFDNGLKISGREIGLRFESVQELTEQIVNVAKNSPEYYNPYITAGQRIFEQLYTNEVNIAKTIEFYNYVMSQSGI